MQSFKKYALISMIILNASALMVLYQSSNASQPVHLENQASREVSIWKSDVESPDLNRQHQLAKAIDTHAGALFHSGSPFTGPSNAQTNLVVFFDHQCLHCKMMVSTLETLQQQNPTLKIIYKDLPILGMHSSCAAKAALAAHQQNKYLSLSTSLLQCDRLNKANILNLAKQAGLNMTQFQSDLAAPHIAQALDQNLQLAHDLTIRGTPVIIISQNLPCASPTFFVIGNVSLDTLQDLVHQAQEG